MYILEIFFKRRKVIEIFETSWKAIGNNIALSQDVKNGADPQLELFYFVSVFYSTVYHAALAAGLSTSSAHYLARIQTKKSTVDAPIVTAAQDIFAAPDDEKLKGYANYLNARIQPIVAAAAKKDCVADEAEIKMSLSELHQYFNQCEFPAEDFLPVKS